MSKYPRLSLKELKEYFDNKEAVPYNGPPMTDEYIFNLLWQISNSDENKFLRLVKGNISISSEYMDEHFEKAKKYLERIKNETKKV